MPKPDPRSWLARALRAVRVFFCGEPEPARPVTLPMPALPQRALDLHDEDEAPDTIPFPLPPLKTFPRIWRPNEWS